MSGPRSTTFGGRLSRFGQSVSRALTSQKTQNFLKNVGSAVVRAARSEFGQRVLTGVAQGAVEAAVTGENLAQTVQKAVVLNVTGTDDQPVDPLNSSEIRFQRKIESIEEVQETDEQIAAYRAKILQQEAKEIPKLLKAIDENRKLERTEQREIELLDKSAEAIQALVAHEHNAMVKVKDALNVESLKRTADERNIISTMEAGYERLRAAALREKTALIEEAVEQSIEIGSNIAEHVAASFPIVGEGIAAGMATARGTMQLYKLGKTISELTGMEVDHLTIPAVSKQYLRGALEGTLPESSEERLQLAVSDKLQHLAELQKEADHFVSVALPKIKESAAGIRTTGDQSKLPCYVMPIPARQLPRIHIYTSAFGSDNVVILHVISPLVLGQSFALMADLEYDYMYFTDVYVSPTRLHGPVENDATMTLETACNHFFVRASSFGMDDAHTRAIRRSIGEDPFYIGSVPYKTSYGAMRTNALNIASSPRAQRHLFRGPIMHQRTALLNAVMHGFALVDKRTSQLHYGPLL